MMGGAERKRTPPEIQQVGGPSCLAASPLGSSDAPRKVGSLYVPWPQASGNGGWQVWWPRWQIILKDHVWN